MRLLLIAAPLLACAPESSSSSESSTGTTVDSTGEPEPTGEPPSVWPRRVTLSTTALATPGEGVRLADGAIVAEGGDLNISQAQVLTLRSPTDKSVCDKDIHAALADVPTDVEACPGSLSGTWESYTYLSAATIHPVEESEAAGLGVLVRDRDHTALYRLHVVGDSYSTDGRSTLVFDYEPVP